MFTNKNTNTRPLVVYRLFNLNGRSCTTSTMYYASTSNSSTYTTMNPKTMAINTTDPWVQINQNAYRVNTIELSNTSNSDIWMCSATTWQYTQVEDDR